MNTRQDPSGSEVSRLLERVSEIGPVIEAGSREAAERGCLPDEMLEAVSSAGLFRFYWPTELGGLALGLTDGVEVVERLTMLDPSTAWIVAVASLHAGFAGAYLAEDVARTLFADAEPIISGQMAPVGRAHPVDGGLEISGRWSFGSGIRHASWVLAGAMLTDEAGKGPEQPIVVIVPRHQVEVKEDSWQVAGLSGTGSCDYTLRDGFVPAGWWFSFPVARRLRGPAVFELPIPAQTIVLHGGFVLGTARRSLEEITTLAGNRTRASMAGPMADDPLFHRELAEHSARLAAARLYVLDVAARLQSVRACDAAPLVLESRAAGRLATDVAVDVTTWAYRRGGGTALRLDSPLQQYLRDTLGASQHLFVDDLAYTARGAALASGTA